MQWGSSISSSSWTLSSSGESSLESNDDDTLKSLIRSAAMSLGYKELKDEQTLSYGVCEGEGCVCISSNWLWKVSLLHSFAHCFRSAMKGGQEVASIGSVSSYSIDAGSSVCCNSNGSISNSHY